MATTVTFIIVPFSTDKRGKLKPGASQHAKDRAKAVSAAERMAPRYAGVMVLEQEADLTADIYVEPKLIRVIGAVPEELIEQLVA